MKTVVSMVFGSHLYGTETPESDTDYKAVHIPDAQEILLQRVRESINSARAKGEGEKNTAADVDQESYSLQRYLQLLAEGQTVAIDMLFAPESALLETSDLWKLIRANKHLLLTKRSAAFVGYCRTQANKYGIRGSRVAAAKKAAEHFQRCYELHGSTAKVSEIAHTLADLEDEHTQLTYQEVTRNGVEFEEVFFECCNRKLSFTSTIKQGAEMLTRIYEAYGDRAKKAQANEGIDWKALSHAVRVGQEALELLSTGEITLPLRNASEIRNIKQGKLTYDAVASQIENLLTQVEEAARVSPLRDNADSAFIDALVTSIYAEEVKGEFE